jgi:hypothetical protein
VREFIALVLSIVCFETNGQFDEVDSALNNAKEGIATLYYEAVQAQSLLYNGREYVDSYENRNLEGHVYFLSNDWQSGNICYNNLFYTNVLLKYNLVTDKLILQSPRTTNDIELISEKISYFTIGEHRFVNLSSIPVIQNSLKVQFVNLIYSGQTSVFQVYEKKVQSEESSLNVLLKVKERRYTYFIKNSNFFVVKSESKALKILSDERQSLRRYLSIKGIKYKKNETSSLVEIVKEYDRLMTQHEE